MSNNQVNEDLLDVQRVQIECCHRRQCPLWHNTGLISSTGHILASSPRNVDNTVGVKVWLLWFFLSQTDISTMATYYFFFSCLLFLNVHLDTTSQMDNPCCLRRRRKRSEAWRQRWRRRHLSSWGALRGCFTPPRVTPSPSPPHRWTAAVCLTFPCSPSAVRVQHYHFCPAKPRQQTGRKTDKHPDID